MRAAVDNLTLVVAIVGWGAVRITLHARFLLPFLFSTGLCFHSKGFLLNDVPMHDTIGFLLVYNATIFHHVPAYHAAPQRPFLGFNKSFVSGRGETATSNTLPVRIYTVK